MAGATGAVIRCSGVHRAISSQTISFAGASLIQSARPRYPDRGQRLRWVRLGGLGSFDLRANDLPAAASRLGSFGPFGFVRTISSQMIARRSQLAVGVFRRFWVRSTSAPLISRGHFAVGFVGTVWLRSDNLLSDDRAAQAACGGFVRPVWVRSTSAPLISCGHFAVGFVRTVWVRSDNLLSDDRGAVSLRWVRSGGLGSFGRRPPPPRSAGSFGPNGWLARPRTQRALRLSADRKAEAASRLPRRPHRIPGSRDCGARRRGPGNGRWRRPAGCSFPVSW